MYLKKMSLIALLFLCSCGTGSGLSGDALTDIDVDTHINVRDSDGDTISDDDEGISSPGGPVDTDGDTIADYLDTDSDGDTIPDSVEAGDNDPSTPPKDSDGDTKPDFQDMDSDNNGIFDGVETTDDADRDGKPDYADNDNDGDGISDTDEIGGNPSSPLDSDNDTIPDYMDTDSDNDCIPDYIERSSDADEDWIPNYRDLDSDADTIPDKDEAGDCDLTTPPRDTDGDRVPDYLDHDSDGDGLSDQWENEHGLSPISSDTDSDGSPDLIEVGVGTDPLDASSNPRAQGNFVFIVPFREDPIPPQDTLVFTTDLQKADVYFIIDSSGSMMEEIDNLRTGLRDTIVPGVRAEIPDVWFGVMRLEDCPWDCGDNSLRNLQNLTNDITAVQNALNTITDTCGGWEPYTLALYITASGDRNPLPANPCPDPSASIGYPCFRSDSIPILMLLGDEDFQEGISNCSPRKTIADAVAAINSISGKFIGVNSGDSHPNMVDVARGTNSVDVAGNPLVFDIPSNGTGLGAQIINAVKTLANQVPIEVSTSRRDDPTDGICLNDRLQRVPCCCTDSAGNSIDCFDLNRVTMGACNATDIFEPVDASREFILRIVPNKVGGIPDPVNPAVVCLGGLQTADKDGDGYDDVFTAVLPGDPVCFDIYAKMNEIVEPLEIPQTFKCNINVVGDEITILSTREVYFLVPPKPIVDVPG